MFTNLTETQRGVVTVLVFCATFFVSLTLGRVLKRRAGVRLGILYQLFSLTLAFYAALAVYGVHANWRNHVGAGVILLSTAFVVALVDRYVWDLYFENRRKITILGFLSDVRGILFFLVF